MCFDEKKQFGIVRLLLKVRIPLWLRGTIIFLRIQFIKNISRKVICIQLAHGRAKQAILTLWLMVKRTEMQPGITLSQKRLQKT